MKILLPMLLLLSQVLACNSYEEGEQSNNADTASATHKEEEASETGLVLNNGAKWKADSLTLRNVALLQDIVLDAKNERLENYLQTGDSLQKGLNKMIADCKMQGPDHDALHQWLHPLLGKVENLNKSTSASSAGAIFTEIQSHINVFSQYFE